MRVLLIQNDAGLPKNLDAYFLAQGIAAELTDTGEEALELVRHDDFDLLVVGVRVRDMDANAVIRRMRAAGRTTPILALSTSRDARARLQAFAGGADDVVDQNVEPNELVARIRAIVRRSRGHAQSSLQIGAVILNLEQQTVVANGSPVCLSGKEFALLQLLMLRTNIVMTKEAILTQLYGGMDEPESKVIDVFVCKIRKKLANVGLADFIGTVWGRGYTVRDQGGANPRPAMPATPEPSDAPRRLVLA